MSSPRQQEWASIQILGVRVDCVDFQQTLDRISAWIAQSRAQDETREDSASHPSQSTRQVCTVNPEFIMAARRNPGFAQVLVAADLCTPDGIGVLWAARLAGVRLNERVTGSDGIHRLCERAAAQGWRVFFLGAAPGVAERAAAELARLYPGLPVAGTYGGSPADADWPQIRQHLTAARADLLFVAYGHPRQDIWIHQHRRGVAGRRRPRHRRRLRLRRRHHPPRPALAAPPRPRMAIPPRPPAMALAPYGGLAAVRAVGPRRMGKAVGATQCGPLAAAHRPPPPLTPPTPKSAPQSAPPRSPRSARPSAPGSPQ